MVDNKKLYKVDASVTAKGYTSKVKKMPSFGQDWATKTYTGRAFMKAVKPLIREKKSSGW